ncbi:carboxylesterase [Rhyzopertha dominica]|nr:carboxylesterase [Rhyzopertha dominica]
MSVVEKSNLAYMILLMINVYSASEHPEVVSVLGTVRGNYRKSYEGRTYSAFEGIPYAKPPIGYLRFKDPQPIEPWDGILKADQLHTCIQGSFLHSNTTQTIVGNEDCLYLNVYTPRQKPSQNDNLDVLVHIHGGGFMYGSAHLIGQPGFIMDREFVFVTLNYRLGALGFLSTQDEVVPGNNGLKDQSLALKWIKRNIIFFGGNTNSITLNGFSAGGASVHYHYFSPLSEGLFHRGFSHSGNALCPWATQRVPLEKFKKLAASLGCDDGSTTLKVDCLKERPAVQIVAHQTQFYYNDILPIAPFGPVVESTVEGAFLSHPIEDLMKAGNFSRVQWVSSNTKNDCGMICAMLENKADEIGLNWDEWSPHLLDYNYTVLKRDKLEIGRKVKEFYFGNTKISKETWPLCTQLTTDRLAIVGAVKSYLWQSRYAPVYNIIFNFKPSFSVNWSFYQSKFDYGMSCSWGRHRVDVFIRILIFRIR